MAYKRTYNRSQFEWDAEKAVANLRKHEVDFSDACLVLSDPLAVTLTNTPRADEARWVTVGQDAEGRLLVVVYTWRGPRVRLISARRATPRETRAYETGQPR